MESNYTVYQHITPDGMHYFGQTQNVEKRWSNNGAGYKKTALQPYIEKFGWDNIQHIVLFRDQTRENALWIEDFLITTAQEDGVCINKHRSGNVSKEEGYYREYYEKNREKKLEYHREYQREYREENREKYNEYYREYREENREKYNEYHRQRYQKNKDEINERRRQRYQRKKEEKQLKEVQTTLF